MIEVQVLEDIMIANLKFSRIVVVVHIPLAKPMTSGDDAVPHRHPWWGRDIYCQSGKDLYIN